LPWFWSPAAGAAGPIGLTDAEHTSSTLPSNIQYSADEFFNAAGRAAGYSVRYFPGGGGEWGRSAWFWSLAVGTRRLGYFDAAHTSSNLYRASDVVGLNNI